MARKVTRKIPVVTKHDKVDGVVVLLENGSYRVRRSDPRNLDLEVKKVSKDKNVRWETLGHFHSVSGALKDYLRIRQSEAKNAGSIRELIEMTEEHAKQIEKSVREMFKGVSFDLGGRS